jgi:glycogen operon protein
MLLHGDELGRTQQGNNNAYCQDNELTWVDWEHADRALVEFTALVSQLRREHPVFRRRRFFDGRPVRRGAGAPLRDITWFTPDGQEMTEEDWEAGFGKSVAVYLNGLGVPDRDSRGERITDDSFLLFFNAHDGPIDFCLPSAEYAEKWAVVLDTATPQVTDAPTAEAQSSLTVEGRSLLVLQKTD